MNTQQFVDATILKATGKPRKLQPTDAKYLRIFDIGNLMINEWENQPDVDWASLYEPELEIGTTQEKTRSYELPDDVKKLSNAIGDSVVLKSIDGKYKYYDVVSADQLKRFEGGRYCAVASGNIIFACDPEPNKSIAIPAYMYAEKLVNNNSVVPVDNPLWLVVRSAAEFARNDIMLQGQYGNLIAESNELMTKMIQNNTGQIYADINGYIPGVSNI